MESAAAATQPESAATGADASASAGAAALQGLAAATGMLARAGRPADSHLQSLEQLFGRIGAALDGVREACADLQPDAPADAEAQAQADERVRAAAVGAISFATASVARLAGEAWGEHVWTGRSADEVLSRFIRAFDVSYADAPFRLVSYAAMLSPNTVHLFDTVIETSVCEWLRVSAKKALTTFETDAAGLSDEARTAFLTHLGAIASGGLPYGYRSEEARSVPQHIISLDEMLAAEAHDDVFGLGKRQAAWLVLKARQILEAHDTAPPEKKVLLTKAHRRHLTSIAHGNMPWGFRERSPGVAAAAATMEMKRAQEELGGGVASTSASESAPESTSTSG